MMSDQSRNGGDRVVETAALIRRIQENLAEEPGEVRRRSIRQEIERALNQVEESDREQFLDELLTRFPSTGGDGPAPLPPPPRPPRKSGTKPQPQSQLHSDTQTRIPSGSTSAKSAASSATTSPGDRPTTSTREEPEELATRLINCWEGIDLIERERIATKLIQHGVISYSAGGANHGLPKELLDRMWEKFQVRCNASTPPDRLIWLLIELLPYVSQSSDVSHRIWRKLASGMSSTSCGPPSVPQKILQQYLTGDERVTRETVVECIEQNKKLLGSLLQTLSVINRIVAQVTERFSIEKIERMAKLEQRNERIFKRKPLAEVCWETFTSIAEQNDPASIEREINEKVAEYLEECLRT